MNVTRNGYYSSQYLDRHKLKSHRPNQYNDNHIRQDDPRLIEDAKEEISNSGFSDASILSGTEKLMNTPKLGAGYIAEKDLPDTSSRPQSSEVASKPSAGPTPNISPSPRFTSGSNRGSLRDEISYDPDYLEQEITPAQLNILQNMNRHRPYKRTREPNMGSQNERKKPVKYDYGSYYIDQKKRYDESPYKPKVYTHRTFRDVFQDKEENMDKYNPMEFVFGEYNDNKKLKETFKALKVKMRKDDYNNYDYYEHKNSPQKKSLVEEIFVEEVSDEDSDINKEKIYISEKEEKQMKKTKNIKNVWKKRFKKVKEELSKDYLANADKQRLAMDEKKAQKAEKSEVNSEESKEAEEEIIAETAEKESVIGELNDGDKDTLYPEIIEPDYHENVAISNETVGSNHEFHPLWNYVLSWLVYDSATVSQKVIEPSNVKTWEDTPKNTNDAETISSKKTKPKSLISAKSLKSGKAIVKSSKSKSQKPINTPAKTSTKLNFMALKKNYKDVVTKWNQPASTLFNNDQIVDQNAVAKLSTNKSIVASKKSSRYSGIVPSTILHEMNNQNSQEFIIELDDDDGDYVDEELYYNPITKQLERTPPTSYSSLDPAALEASDSMKIEKSMKNGRLIDTSGGPVTIISNINALIKNIRIMKIIFAPIDVIAESFPNLQTIVILVELVIFLWILYEVSLLIDALCMMVKAICAPMIAMGRFMNRIM